MRSFTDMRFLMPIVQCSAAKSHTLGVSSCSLLCHTHTCTHIQNLHVCSHLYSFGKTHKFHQSHSYRFKNPGSFWIAFLHQLQLSVGKEIQNIQRETFSLIGNASNSMWFLICSKVLPRHLTGRQSLHALWLDFLKCWAIQCCQP